MALKMVLKSSWAVMTKIAGKVKYKKKKPTENRNLPREQIM